MSIAMATEPKHALSGAIGVDRRTTAERRHTDILNGLLAQAGSTSVDIEQKARRVAGLAVWIEQQEAAITRGDSIDMRGLTTAINTQRRLMRDLGLSPQRRGRVA